MTIDRRSFVAAASALGAAAVLPTRARAADELRVAFIPEVATTATSISDKQPFVDWLQKVTGRSIKLILPTNYAATVEAIGNSSVDLAHFGGVTFLKAHARYNAQPLVQREEDRHFHSLFITNSPDVKKLTDVKGKAFAFGDVASTSGHLIPAKDLIDAGVDPEKDINARFTGNHTTTAIAVNSGQVVAGALDESVYKKMVSDKTIDGTKARVFYTSEPFMDYVWAARPGLEASLVSTLRTAFVGLKDPTVLGLLRATKYVPANFADYAQLSTVAKKLDLL